MPFKDEQGRVWLTVTEAAEASGKVRRTMYHWIERGLVTVRRSPSGTIRILRESLFRPETEQARVA